MKAARVLVPLALALLACLTVAAPAAAAQPFGLKELEAAFEEEAGLVAGPETSGLTPYTEGGGPAATLAGGHPFQFTTGFAVAAEPFVVPRGSTEIPVPADALKDLRVALPTGMAGDPTAVPPCPAAEFVDIELETGLPACADDTAVGVAFVLWSGGTAVGEGEWSGVPVWNLAPLPGEAARLGMLIENVPVTIDLRVAEAEPYEVVAGVDNVSQAINVLGSRVVVWGNPADPAHDPIRGHCLFPRRPVEGEPTLFSRGSCAYEGESRGPFLTSPRACVGPLAATFRGDPWGEPGAWVEGAAEAGAGFEGCEALGFKSSISSTPTTTSAESSAGLDFGLNLEDPGLTESGGTADSDIEKAVVTLPEGITTNPSVASGLAACTLAEYEEEALESRGGCPEASKIGSVEVETPLLEEETEGGGLVPDVLPGRIYVAHQHDNVFDNLLTIYMVIEDPKLGIFIKLPGRVEPDPQTGRLKTTFGEPGYELPQLPFSHFRLHFNPGERAPLITPPGCGTYATEALLYPWANPSAPVRREATFEINGGAGGSACASRPPAHQSVSAWTADARAGSYSPFVLKVSRDDGTQHLSGVSATLPEGLLGKLAGIPYCSDAQIAQAQGRTGEGQGAVERADPSCPAASEVGTVIASAGAGPEPLYVTGHAYLAGPYRGAPLSLEIITPAIAGPFDLGVVAVRTALQVDSLTAQVTATSDAIPTILHGLPLDLRSISVELNRPEFTLNPTSCEPTQISGSVATAPEAVTPFSQYFQAYGCEALPFRPRLSLRVFGKTNRNAKPRLRAVLAVKPGEAGIARAQVNLPHSEFLEQGHLDKTCTKPLLLAGNCPKSTIYGHARAWTPLLQRPLEGDVYVVGGFGYELPALVAELNGQIRVLVVGRVDSGKNQGLRTTFETVPDAPVSKFVLEMKGGKRGLLVNSENLCSKTARKRRAIVRFTGHNGKVEAFKPKVANQCGKRHAKKPKAHKRQGAG